MFYQKIVNYCQKNNISISAFEKKCGIGNGVVSGWKDDGSQPALKTLKKIESAIGIPIEELLKE